MAMSSSRSALVSVMEGRAKYLESRPHRPRVVRPHLAQELREVRTRHQFDDPDEVTRTCKRHARMCAKGQVRLA